MFRDTQVLQEDLVFQVLTDVMVPEGREEILDFLENKALLDNRSVTLIRTVCVLK